MSINESIELAGRGAATQRRPATSAYRAVRQIHLWVGAWGALAALFFGITGMLMNHRFGDKPWPQGASREAGNVTLEVPAAARDSKEALRAWLRSTHRLAAATVKTGKPENKRVGGREVKQPGKWQLSGGTARRSWSLEYVPGNVTAELKRNEQSPLAALLRVHKGYGGGLGWRLLQDSFAIGMILLGLSGIWMWARGRTPRQMVFSVMGLSTLLFGALLAIALA